ncbi:MAG: ABC transporter ATP-binding protein [Desulfobacterales bacterium]|jgi:branched-chain amino acid transport system ATP-binding protein
MLWIEDIHVQRGKTHVLRGVNLHVGQGEVVALIGANGAGKTTTLRTISGLLRPKSGQILFQSPREEGTAHISQMSPENIVHLGISHCPEGRGVFARLTVKENLFLGAYLRKDKKDILADCQYVCRLFPILGERLNQAAGSLSGGEQEMLAVGRALMSRPELLILDEPSLGLAPVVVDMLFSTLTEINRQGVTILLVEQNAMMSLELAHRAYVLETGKIALSGSSRELTDDPNIRRIYLGGI